MGKYDAVFQLGTPRNDEFEAVHAAYDDLGFATPRDLTESAFLVGVGEPFFPTELAPKHHLAGDMKDVGAATIRYFAEQVRPELERAVKDDDERVQDLAYKLGRFTGQVIRSGNLVSGEEPLDINNAVVRTNTEEIPITLDETDATVLDFGMGMIGLSRHLSALKKDMYTLVGIQKHRLETVALQGIVDYQKYRPGQVILLYGGITSGVEQLIADEWDAEVDIVIASRIHGAGNDLISGLERTPPLLRDDSGIIIARGPRRRGEQTVGYDQVRDALERLDHVRITLDMPYARSAGHYSSEPSRLIVAQKV